MSSDLVFLTFRLNGTKTSFHVRAEEMLIDVLRERANLTGTKLSCDLGACGACTVLLDGKPAASCGTFAWQAADREVRTVEGLADKDGDLDPVQAAFVDNSAFQCGYCTPGFVMAMAGLFEQCTNPTEKNIKNHPRCSNKFLCWGHILLDGGLENFGMILKGF